MSSAKVCLLSKWINYNYYNHFRTGQVIFLDKLDTRQRTVVILVTKGYSAVHIFHKMSLE